MSKIVGWMQKKKDPDWSAYAIAQMVGLVYVILMTIRVTYKVILKSLPFLVISLLLLVLFGTYVSAWIAFMSMAWGG